jgi:hypothetical protein
MLVLHAALQRPGLGLQALSSAIFLLSLYSVD